MKNNESDASLETLIRSLPLREPGGELDARVEATFAQYRVRSSHRFYQMAIAAGLLIVLGVGAHLMLSKKTPAISSVAVAKTATPIQIERDTSTVYDDGIVARTDDAAYQQYRRRTLREIWYINPSTHARALITIPTEQIVIEKMDAF